MDKRLLNLVICLFKFCNVFAEERFSCSGPIVVLWIDKLQSELPAPRKQSHDAAAFTQCWEVDPASTEFSAWKLAGMLLSSR